MLTLNQTFEDNRTIKILVVPLGGNTLFDRYFEIVSRLREIPFYELNWPQFAISSKPKILRHINLSNGSLRFEHLRYDRVSFGPSDLDNFQSSKRVLMIIGLVNYPEIAESASKIEEEFDYYSRKNPHIILRRIFVFNYFFDEPTSKIETVNRPVPKSFSKDPTSVIVFPPEGNCSEGAISMVDVHLQEVMAHTSVKLINSLEKQLNHCEEARLANNLPVYALLSTHYDDIDDAEGSATVTSFGSKVNRKNVKRGLGGRIHKWMGDLCMQMCSPLDAVENYAFAINECRTNNDSLWLAGALDGYASSILLLITFQYALEDILGRDLRSLNVASLTTSVQQTETGDAVNILENVEAKCVRLAEERAFEAAIIYSKNMAYSVMEVECLLRIARMYETNQWVVEREQKILEYVTKATTVSGLNSQQQIECMLEGALMFNRLGLRRKYGFFLYAAVLLCIECNNLSFAQSLIHFAGEQFGIVSNFTGIVDRPAAYSDVFVVEPHLSWSKMRAVLFTKGISIATEVKDNSSATRYFSALLRLMSDEELRHSMTRQNWTIFQDLYFRVKEYQSTSLKAPTALALAASPTVNSRTIPRPIANISAEDSIFSSPAPPLRKLHASPPLAAAMISGYSYLVNNAHHNIDSQESVSLDNDNYSGGSVHNNRSGDDPAFSHANLKGTGFDAHHGRRISTDYSQAQPRLQLYSSLSGKESPADTSETRFGDRNSRKLSTDSYVAHGGGAGNRLLMSNSQKDSLDPKLNNINIFSEKSCGFFPRMSAKLLESIESDNNGNTYQNSSQVGNAENGMFTWQMKEVQFRQMKDLIVAVDEFRDENNFRVAHLSNDFISFISSVLSEGSTPTLQQDETVNAFMALTRRVPPNSQVILPVSLISLRPRRLVSKEGSPISATPCAAIQAAQKNYSKFFATNSGSLREHDATTDRVNTKSSALFFDPFAKKRAKQQQDSEIISRQVLWPIGGDYFLVAVFRNPLSMPLVLSSVQPILDCNACRDVCSLRLFPVSVTIPARAERFEVDLRVQIHPISGTINNIEKSVKVMGIQIRINNAECSVSVDKLGLASSIREMPSSINSGFSSTSTTSNQTSGVSTNEVIIISPLPRLMLDFTGLSVANEQDDSDISNSKYHSAVDLNISIDILPGEKRSETLAIKQLPLFATDELGREIRFDGSSAGSDLKISILEVESPSSCIGQTSNSKKIPVTKTTDFLNYSRFLCVPNTDCSPATGSNDKKSSNLKSEHCRLKSFKTETTTDSSGTLEDYDHAFHVDLITVEFSYPENAVSVYMNIEIPTSFDKANLENICRMSRASNLQSVTENGGSIQPVYARLLRLRVDLIPQLGLHLNDALVVGNSHVLDESEVLTRSSLVRTLQYYYPTEDEAPDIEIAHDHISVSYEIFNRSNFSMLLDSKPSSETNNLDWQGFNDADVESETFRVMNTCESGSFSSKSTSIICIPAYSARKILLRYPPDAASHLPPATLRWSCNDTTVKRGRRIRFGEFECSVATTNFRQSIHRNLIFQPPVRVSCTMSLLNGRKHAKTNEETVKLRSFVDIEVLVCLLQGAASMQLDAQRLELVLTILNRDMLVVDGQKSTSASANRDYVVSGGMHRKILLKGLVGDSIVHKIRVCFLRQGNYSIHPLFRIVPNGSVWWTSPEKLSVTVNLE